MHDAIYRLRMCSVTEKVDRGLDDLDCSVGFRLSWRMDGVADIRRILHAREFDSEFLHLTDFM